MSIQLIQCTIECGAFSSERTFEVQDASGTKIMGVANVSYLLDENHNPLSDDQPAPGKSIQGFVQCRMVRSVSQSEKLIEVPSSDLIKVRNTQLTTIPTDALVSCN